MFTEVMIKVYKMALCPDCIRIAEQLSDSSKYEVIDIGEHPRNLKQFLALRDSSPAFAKVRERGAIGIPCFVLEDGTITFKPEMAGIVSAAAEGASCSLDNRKGC